MASLAICTNSLGSRGAMSGLAIRDPTVRTTRPVQISPSATIARPTFRNPVMFAPAT